ncbi:MAG: EAL domain-containing protein [Methylotenera sp.]|nr:EAL domain-containing protein [Methylotenera sp.]
MNLKKLLQSEPIALGADKDSTGYKITFLNSVFLFAGIVALGMGFYRIQSSLLLGIVDFLYSALVFGLIFYLNQHKEKVDFVSSIALIASFTLFYAIYLTATYNTIRVSLFFLLVASAFFLKGRKIGLLSAGISLVLMLAGHFLPFGYASYSHLDMLTASLYLVALVFIFNNYEKSIKSQNAALHLTRFSVESASDALLWMTPDSRIVDANASACKSLGYTRQELLKLSLSDIDSNFDAEIWPQQFVALQQQGSIQIESDFRKKDNGLFPVEIVANHIQLDGKNYICAFVRDITERKLAEVNLSVSEKRYRSLFETAKDAIFIMSGELFIDCNKSALAMFHCTREQIINVQPYIFSPPTQPDGRDSKSSALEKINNAINNQPQTFEWWHKRADGSVFDAEVSLDAFSIEDNTYLVAFVRDITERKRVERELRIAATAFESQEAVMVTDENQVILKVNHAFTRITGFSSEESVGKTPQLLKSGRQEAAFYQAMWQSLNNDHFWQGEIWNRRKSGEGYPEWLSITAICDITGKVMNYVATFSDITQRKKAEEIIHNLSFYDSLTGLPNRQSLLVRLKDMMLSSARRETPGALMVINLDDFKLLNDTRGHSVGDLLLIEVAKRIRACLHLPDMVARLGSDDFVVSLDYLNKEIETAAKEANTIAERIRTAIRQPFYLNGYEYNCTACIGINLFHNHDATTEELLKNADAALSQAKEAGRDKIHFFDEGMQVALEERVLMQSFLRKAIPEQLKLYYQPQVDHDGNIFGAETLIRWSHPEKGEIPPNVFIPLAEESGLILLIGRWTLVTACEQLKAWESNQNTRHLTLAVNVSAHQFQQVDFVAQVLEVLSQTKADPSRLKLELTESMLVQNVETIIKKMNTLKATGVTFSLDDFGTGFSSLSYLKRLPLCQLKIDQSFIRDLFTDPSDAAIVRTIVTLGQSLGLSVIAEGVETEEQRNTLAINGCLNYQGYLFGKAVPLADFEKLLVKTQKTV